LTFSRDVYIHTSYKSPGIVESSDVCKKVLFCFVLLGD
jgi:hypothetical protein